MTMGYLGNPLLKRSDTPVEWTPEMIQEFAKCAKDPIYFAEKYIKIVHVDRGLIPIKLYEYQKEIINAVTFNRRVACNTSRQAGKCVSINTIIKIKLENEVLNITMGELHEIFLEETNSRINDKISRWDRICGMFDLWVSVPRLGESSEGPRSKERNLFWPYSHKSSYSKQNSSFKRSCTAGKLQESVVWTWGAVLADKQQKSVDDGRNSKSNDSKNVSESFLRHTVGLLDKEGIITRRSKTSIIKSPKYLFAGETGNQARQRNCIEDLEGKTSSLAENTTSKNTRRNIRNKQKESKPNKLPQTSGRKMRNRRSSNFIFDTLVRYWATENWNNFENSIRKTFTTQEKVFNNKCVGEYYGWEGVRNRTENIVEQSEYNSSRWKFRDISFGNFYSRNNESNRNSYYTGMECFARKSENNVEKENLDSKTNRKFVRVFDVDDILVDTPAGWERISRFNITIPYSKFLVQLEDGKSIECADDHIFIEANGEQIYAKDCLNTYIQTANGNSLAIKVTDLNVKETMYDLSVNSEEHVYFTNDILSHNTTTAVAIILHYILFNEYKSVALLANKAAAATEILSRIQLAYEALPSWLQQGIVTWNKGSIELENGCKVIAAASSSSSIRGKSISFLYIDETAFLMNWDEFFASVYPTISSGEETKILLTSTPKGLNHFWKICKEAQEEVNERGAGKNGYIYIEVKWDRVPGRGQEWMEDTLASIGRDMEQFAQEFNCDFIGSSGSLISGAKLKELSADVPIFKNEHLFQYENVIKGHTYALIGDVSRGKGLDYSTFSVVDVSSMPYKQVCTFRDNMIGPVDFAGIINRIAKIYNEAHVMIEINDIGGQVSDVLYLELGYENLLFTENAGRSGKRISGGFGKNVDRGIRTTKSVKAIGCSMLKMLIEQNQLQITDHATIEEIKRFSRKGVSYEAESGFHDDMVMTLVLFGWLSDQNYFKEITDINTLNALKEKSDSELDESMLPFGFIVNSADVEESIVYVSDW